MATPDSLTALIREFIAYWTTERTNYRGGCGMCGGIPHSTTCFVGRFDAVDAEQQFTALQDAVRLRERAFEVMAKDCTDPHARAAFATCAEELRALVATPEGEK